MPRFCRFSRRSMMGAVMGKKLTREEMTLDLSELSENDRMEVWAGIRQEASREYRIIQSDLDRHWSNVEENEPAYLEMKGWSSAIKALSEAENSPKVEMFGVSPSQFRTLCRRLYCDIDYCCHGYSRRVEELKEGGKEYFREAAGELVCRDVMNRVRLMEKNCHG